MRSKQIRSISSIVGEIESKSEIGALLTSMGAVYERIIQKNISDESET